MEDKWQFVENKICPYCKKDISNYDYVNEPVITYCGFCKRSYID